MNFLLSLIGVSSLITSGGLSVIKNENTNSNNICVENDNILVGYWHNFDNARGYRNGNAKYIDLKDVSDEYNVISVSFMKVFEGYGDVPTFIPLVATHPEMNQEQKKWVF